LRTVHAPKPLVMNIQSIDPSMALGFLCESREDYVDFTQRVRDFQREFGSLSPFSVAARRPDYAASEMEMLLADCFLSSPGESMHEDAMSNRGTSHESDDDEYVLI
jgi:cysteine protease ATG4